MKKSHFMVFYAFMFVAPLSARGVTDCPQPPCTIKHGHGCGKNSKCPENPNSGGNRHSGEGNSSESVKAAKKNVEQEKKSDPAKDTSTKIR